MLAKEKARANGPIPNAVLADGLESIRPFKVTQEFARALARVVYEPIGKRFGIRALSRIRSWRAAP
jgi:hypothetical protein